MRTAVSLYAGVCVAGSVWLPVSRLTGLVVEFIGMYSSPSCTRSVTKRAHPHAAVPRGELHQAAALDTARACQFRRYLDERVGSFFLDAGAAIGQIALVKMFQQTAVIQMKVELGVSALLRLAPCQRDTGGPSRRGMAKLLV